MSNLLSPRLTRFVGRSTTLTCSIVLGGILSIRWVSPVGYERLGDASSASSHAIAGEISVLTYNVAGLPQVLSGSRPRDNATAVGSRLDQFDLVLLQEDFCYHGEISAATTLPHRSFGGCGARLFGDGLTLLGRVPMSPTLRQPWCSAHGVFTSYHDELAEKGFSRTSIALAQGVDIDVYDLHADAGSTADDQRVRAEQFSQLARHIATHSIGRAVVVGGDFNLLFSSDDGLAALTPLLHATGLESVYDRLGAAPEVLDGFLVRSGDSVLIEPKDCWIPEGWVDASRRPLSDHSPIALRIGWVRTAVTK